MKTLMIIVIVVLGFNVYSLCVSSVPDAVKSAFAQKFPVRKDVSWSKGDSSRFVADFSIHGADTQAYFTADGKWLETKTEVDLSQLPRKVIETIHKDYPQCSIVQIEKIENSQNDIVYETDIMSTRIEKELELNGDGTLYR
jgi:hypothetical protein